MLQNMHIKLLRGDQSPFQTEVVPVGKASKKGFNNFLILLNLTNLSNSTQPSLKKVKSIEDGENEKKGKKRKEKKSVELINHLLNTYKFRIHFFFFHTCLGTGGDKRKPCLDFDNIFFLSLFFFVSLTRFQIMKVKKCVFFCGRMVFVLCSHYGPENVWDCIE